MRYSFFYVVYSLLDFVFFLCLLLSRSSQDLLFLSRRSSEDLLFLSRRSSEDFLLNDLLQWLGFDSIVIVIVQTPTQSIFATDQLTIDVQVEILLVFSDMFPCVLLPT